MAKKKTKKVKKSARKARKLTISKKSKKPAKKQNRKLPKIWEVGKIKTMPDGSVKQLTAKGSWIVLSKAPKKVDFIPIPKPILKRANKATLTEMNKDHNRLVLKVATLEKKLAVCTKHLLKKHKASR